MMETGAYFVGALGAFLIFLSWVPVFRESLKGRRIPAEFELLMFFGAVLLTMYSYWLGDVIFTVLNLGVAVFSFLTLEYVPRRTARKRIMRKLEEVQREIEKLELMPVKTPATTRTTTRKTIKKKAATARKKTTTRKKTATTKKKTTTKRKTTAKKKTTTRARKRK